MAVLRFFNGKLLGHYTLLHFRLGFHIALLARLPYITLNICKGAFNTTRKSLIAALLTAGEYG
jgi:hypothetical protein